ncbi:MAG: hypothetical protein QXM31_03615 [Candidatus Woesearchaeota archaeon]
MKSIKTGRISRRGFISAAGALCLGSIMGCKEKAAPIQTNEKSATQQIEYPSELSFTKALEREVRSWDDWIVEVLESNYTRPRERDFGIRQTGGKKIMFMSTGFSITNADALYDPAKRDIVLTTDNAECSAFAHEMGHAIFDDYKRQGIIFKKEYSGPDENEWKKCIAKRKADREFRETLESQLRIARLNTEIKSLKPIIDEYLQDMKAIAEMKKRISDEKDIKRIKSLESILGIFQKDIPQADLLSAEANIDLHQQGDKLQSYYSAAVKQVQSMAQLHEYLNKCFDDIAKIGKKHGLKYSQTPSGTWVARSGAFCIINEETFKFENVFSDTEIFARIIASLKEIYTGKPTLSNFRLNEEELNLLGRMKYKGMPMFRKDIEKYRIALQMNDQAKNRQLRYSTGGTFNGVAYSWPENNWTLQGEIPVYENN